MKRLLLIITAVLFLVSCQQAETSKTPGYIVQVCLGDWFSQDYSTQEVIDRIEEVRNIIPVEKVIIGWPVGDEPYKEIGEYLHKNGIQMLLWLPVFAETEKMCYNEPAVDLWGNEPSNFDLTAGEGFRFNCPSNEAGLEMVEEIFDGNFKNCGFDGVFIDRIRTQSFVSGVSGILNCGCDECAAYYKEHGLDLADVRAEYEKLGDKFFNVTSYDPLTGFSFENPLAEKFFQIKGELVSGSVAKVADHFHEEGLIVGMDLYAPLMAQFVGQNYSILAEHADFIKPMLYRQTFAPAGIGFEYDLLKQSVPGAEGYPEIAMDLEFLNGQLDAMADLPCAKYPGIEINYRKKIAPTSPEYVTESLQAIKDRQFEGAVLSWNIMEAPDEHIECLNVLK